MRSILDLPGDVLWLILREVIIELLSDRKRVISLQTLRWFEVGFSLTNDWDSGPAYLMRTLACVCKKFKDVIKQKCVKKDTGWFFRKGALTG
jgi:hypothetical protein